MGIQLKHLVAAGLVAMSGSVTAHPLSFVASLFGTNEAPPNSSQGLGSAVVVIDPDDFSMHVQATFAGLTGNVSAAHIHCCTSAIASGIAGVATVTPTFTGFPSGVTAGSYDHKFDMSVVTGNWNPAFVTANGGTAGTAFSTFLSGMQSGKAYFNIHTSVVPGGEIRGFFAAAPVPEPSTYGLMLAGLVGMTVLARRRKAV